MNDAHQDAPVTVAYDIKEILVGIYHRFDKVDDKLEGLAKQKDLAELAVRVAILEVKDVDRVQAEAERASVAEALDKQDAMFWTRNRKVAAAAVVAFQFAISIAALGPDVLPW